MDESIKWFLERPSAWGYKGGIQFGVESFFAIYCGTKAWKGRVEYALSPGEMQSEWNNHLKRLSGVTPLVHIRHPLVGAM
jgi:hypothetical protein